MSNRLLIYTQNMMTANAHIGNTNVSHNYIYSAIYSSSIITVTKDWPTSKITLHSGL